MAIFKFGKKKEEKNVSCCTQQESEAKTYKESENTASGKPVTSVKVLGSGCKSCHALYENVKEAAAELSLKAEVEYVTDMKEIMQYGIMSMPALVINDQVVSAGRILKPADLKALLSC